MWGQPPDERQEREAPQASWKFFHRNRSRSQDDPTAAGLVDLKLVCFAAPV